MLEVPIIGVHSLVGPKTSLEIGFALAKSLAYLTSGDVALAGSGSLFRTQRKPFSSERSNGGRAFGSEAR